MCEIAKESGKKYGIFANGWVFAFAPEKGGTPVYIHGYLFPLNNAASAEVANDKATTSAVLNSLRLKAVHHEYFMPDATSPLFISNTPNKRRIYDFCGKYPKVVVKPNAGTGGENVFFADTAEEAFEYASGIFALNQDVAICPFIDIKDEYRVIMLNGIAEITYKKLRPGITGDGVSTVNELFNTAKNAENRYKKVVLDDKLDGCYVPKKGETVLLNPRHNLGLGSVPCFELPESIKETIIKTAKKALNALNLVFASVDIIENSDGAFSVLEVNSGVMLERLAGFDETSYQKAKTVYKKAFDLSFLSAKL
ncbi:MAG: hypothetical protein LBN25_00470 [Christensenellaceae bacterium]|nr:hypothetical protein [Christensenellaceae bacterium]